MVPNQTSVFVRIYIERLYTGMLVTYSGRLGDWYNSFGAETLTSKNTSSFHLSVVFQQIC